jgi:hypothetical protein
MNRRSASEFVKSQANAAVPPEDRERFIEIADAEILGLHEGNIARFRLRPLEFAQWRQTWQQSGGREEPRGHMRLNRADEAFNFSTNTLRGGGIPISDKFGHGNCVNLRENRDTPILSLCG